MHSLISGKSGCKAALKFSGRVPSSLDTADDVNTEVHSAERSTSPIVTRSLSCPSSHIVSPLKPVSDVVAGTIWLLISGRSRLKQCS
uniref:Uncharacterized protein n=1 Tax=Tanacetum cinerariifolium TaxID=118510 RepID=A0A699VP18_TANCI|nr:hypothetical protein [Tanacetum cinerariifolium]